LARDATTPAIKKHLEAVALDYERLADRVDESGSTHADGSYSGQGNPAQGNPGQSSPGQSSPRQNNPGQSKT
jgi:hypothetical protein